MSSKKNIVNFIIIGIWAFMLLFVHMSGVIKSLSVLGQSKERNGTTFLQQPLQLDCSMNAPVVLQEITMVDLGSFRLPRDLFLNSFLYEVMVKYKTPLVPLNGIVVDGEVTYFYCNKPDYVFKLYADSPRLVFAVAGDNVLKNREAIQRLVDRFKVVNLTNGELVLDANQHVTVKTRGEACDLPYCQDVKLYVDPIAARDYKIDVVGVEYPKKVLNPSEVTVKVRFKNMTDYVLPSADVIPLLLKEISKVRIPQLYSYTWQDLKLVGVVNQDKSIPPHEEFEYEFKVGPYLKPGARTSQFALALGEREVGQRFEVSIEFTKGDYDLGVIVTEYRAVNVRSAPSIRSEVLFKLLPGDYVIWHKQEGAWVYIETAEGNKGWIYRRFIRKYRGN